VKLLRVIFKRIFQTIALIAAFPAAALSLFGRIRPMYTFFAQSFALGPGLPGSYLRAAYHKMTLHRSSIDVTLAFGTYFVQPDTALEEGVSIGAYCVIGRCSIGARSQIASHVLIPSGRRQHVRNADGSLSDLANDRTVIGADCWIGDGAIVMADLGESVTVGAGSVVTKPVLAGLVVAGNPARPIQRAASPEGIALETVTGHS
jgi:acetyltransferase-like isoleucine patch superfamily enzyme